MELNFEQRRGTVWWFQRNCRQKSGISFCCRSVKSPLKLVTRHAVDDDTFRDYKYLGTRIMVDGTGGEYKWMTYGEAGTARTVIGSGLIYHGIPKGACVGLYFINIPEWIIVDHACSGYSFLFVPLYDTLGPDACKYIVNYASIQAVFCVPQTMNAMLSCLSEIPTVFLIVGRSNLQPFHPPKPEDVAIICYTSGTTGTPKIKRPQAKAYFQKAIVDLYAKLSKSDPSPTEKL